MYISHEYQDIDLGDKFIVENHAWSKTTHSRPLEVIKVTKQQFTLEPIVPEGQQTDDMPKLETKQLRFMRTTGKRVGDADRFTGPRARRATPQYLQEVREYEERIAKEEREQKEAADQLEHDKRVLYGAEQIVNEKVQKVLKPLRDGAEKADAAVTYHLRHFKDMTINESNFANIASRMSRLVEEGSIEDNAILRDLYQDLHERIVSNVHAMMDGTVFEQRGETITRVEELAISIVEAELQRETGRFFYHSMPQDAEAKREYIETLQNITGTRHDYEFPKARD